MLRPLFSFAQKELNTVFKKNKRPLYVPNREPEGCHGGHVYCAERGDLCLGCPYPKRGFICWFTDGTCLKTEMNRILRKDGEKQ